MLWRVIEFIFFYLFYFCIIWSDDAFKFFNRVSNKQANKLQYKGIIFDLKNIDLFSHFRF